MIGREAALHGPLRPSQRPWISRLWAWAYNHPLDTDTRDHAADTVMYRRAYIE